MPGLDRPGPAAARPPRPPTPGSRPTRPGTAATAGSTARPSNRRRWRSDPLGGALPPSYDAVSPIRRPRAFARALGALAAEQAGPRGRTVLLRSTVDGEAFSTAHRSQTVYHGPVVYSDDPYRRLERASSDLELRLLLVFPEGRGAPRPARVPVRGVGGEGAAGGPAGPPGLALSVSPMVNDYRPPHSRGATFQPLHNGENACARLAVCDTRFRRMAPVIFFRPRQQNLWVNSGSGRSPSA